MLVRVYIYIHKYICVFVCLHVSLLIHNTQSSLSLSSRSLAFLSAVDCAAQHGVPQVAEHQAQEEEGEGVAHCPVHD